MLSSMILPGWLLMVGVVVTESATMTTTLGIISGADLSNYGINVSVFYGIPYAKPPVGDLRFKPPEPARTWEGTRYATSLPNSCWQTEDNSFNRTAVVNMWNFNTNRSEDCLYLNVWKPDTPGTKAVLVWIYGGGFWGGTSTLDVYKALTLAARNNIIVVSFNYRVGPFGFLYCGTPDCPGNVGLLDQVMALKWIKDNAANMGGDPTKITIFGESAGAASVGFHLMSPLSMDLFTYAVMMSSSPTVPWGLQSHAVALNRTKTFACLIDCSERSLGDTVAYLRTVDPILLTQTQWKLIYYYFDTPFAPVVDGKYLLKHPTDIMAEGKVKNTSIIMGVVKDEGSYWLLYGFQGVFGYRDPNPVSSSQYATVVEGILRPLGQNFTLKSVKDFTMKQYHDSVPPWDRGSYLDSADDLCGDTLFKCPVVDFAQFYSSKIKGQVFMYSFEHRISTITWPQWMGVPHGYELQIFFGRPWSEAQDNYTDDERKLSDDIMTRITNFAKTGNPNSVPKSLTVIWPEYTHEEQNYLVMNVSQMHVQQGLRYRECEFWKTQVPMLQATVDSSSSCRDAAERPTPWTINFFIINYITILLIIKQKVAL